MRQFGKVALSIGLLVFFISIYILISVFFISRIYNTNNYAEQISEMKIYAQDIALDNSSKYEGEYEILSKEIGDITDSNTTSLNIILKYTEKDIRLTTQYPINIIDNKLIVDEKNPKYSISNPNLVGNHLLLAIVFSIIYLNLRHSLITQKHH